VRLFDKNDVEGWRAHLDDQGFAVLTDILTAEEHSELLGQFRNDWRTVAPYFNWYDPSTWIPESCPMTWDNGMISWYGLGHAEFQWRLRTNRSVLDIWKRLYGTKELVVSYDGFSVFLSNQQDPDMWLHIDQNPKSGFYSIQGAYNFLEVSDQGDAGWVVVPGSHETYVPDVHPQRQYISVEDADPIIEQAIQPLLPPNSFVLWNSRTVHANQGMAPDRETPNLNRVTSYITFFPKSLRGAEMRQCRIEGYYDAENCGHYAFRHDVKRGPMVVASPFQPSPFNWIKPKLDEDGDIPAERMALI
jgi:hypothetical protein